MDITLLQLNDFSHTRVILCRVEVTRSVSTCRRAWYHPDLYNPVENGQLSYIEDTTRSQCELMHANRIFTFRNFIIIPNLKPNGTTTTPATLAGHLGDSQSECVNAPYIDQYFSGQNVIVQRHLKITLENYLAPVNLETGEIIMNTGTRCRLQDEFCVDLFGGDVYFSS